MRRLILGAALAGALAPALAASPAEFLAQYAAQARRSAPAFAGFSAERGARLFAATHANDWSCASCHGQPPNAEGRHAKTGKRIAPLAPAANGARFTDPSKVEKWFTRNCRDVLARECSAQEKGDLLAYLVSVGS